MWGDLRYRSEAYDIFISFGSEHFPSRKSLWLVNNVFQQTSTSLQSIKQQMFHYALSRNQKRSCIKRWRLLLFNILKNKIKISFSDLMLGKDYSGFICTWLEINNIKRKKERSCASLILKYNIDGNNNSTLLSSTGIIRCISDKLQSMNENTCSILRA